MPQNNFIMDLIASLKKTQSKKQIKADIKTLGDIYVPLVGKLAKTKTRAQLKKDISNIEVPVKVTGKFNKKGLVESAQQATSQVQKEVNRKSIQVNMNLKKDKLINDIKVFGQQNSKIFKDAGLTNKYNSLLNNAKLATSNKEIKNLRLQLSAMRSEIKAVNKNGLTLGDTLKKTFKRATELFMGTGGILLLTRQLRNAWTEALNLDKAYTNLIKVQSELTRNDYPNYLERCNKKAQELATTQQALIESVTEFSKSGYNLTDSNALSKQSMILANVGEMSASDSAKSIISGIQAYDIVDGYTDVEKKAQALIDKFNEIGNTSSITTAEIAQGVQAVGSVFADANTSVDEFIALLSAGNRQFQDANSLALSLRTSALRIRGSKVELEEMGEETEGVITSVSKLEEQIKALTNINGSGGVKLLEEDGETYRSIYDIYVDIAKVYKDMSDVDQSALLELIAGKHRASGISAVLNNMSEAQEIYQRSLKASGSAQREYDKYLQSSEASLNRFKSSMTETYQSVINGKTVTGILNCTNATLQFVNGIGLVESSLKGIIAIGIVKAITRLSTAFKVSTVNASKYGTALKTVKNMSSMTKGTTEYANALNTLKMASVGLSDAQLKQVLSSKALSESDRIAILRTTGLTRTQAKAKLTQMGLTQSTKAQTKAQNGATASTVKLSAAVRGFGANLKAFFMSNWITISIMAISTAIGAISSAVDSAKEKLNEIKQKTKEQAEESYGYVESLIDLKKQLEEGTTSSNELTSALKSQLRTMGYTETQIDSLITKYGSLAGAIDEATREALENAKTDAYADMSTSGKALIKDAKGKTNVGIGSLYQKYPELFNQIKEMLDNSTAIKDGGIWRMDKNATAEEIYAYYETLKDISQLIQETAAETNDESLLGGSQTNPTAYYYVTEAINALSESANLYSEAIERLHKADAQLEVSDYLKTHNIESKREFDDYINSIKNSTEYSEAYKNVLISVAKDAFPQFSGQISNAANSVDGFSNKLKDLSITDSIKQIADQLEPQFAKLGEAYRDIFTEDGFTLDNIDNSMLKDLSDTFTDIEEELGVTFDTTQLDNFFAVLMNGSSTAEDVQKAFNNLATSYLNSTDVLESLNEETAESVIKQLEQMGVTNAETLVNDALTLKLKWVEKAKENNIETTNELLDATYEEISALKDEDGKLDETEQKLYNLWMQKNAVNDITIVTNGDIQNLVSLMETADSACENLKKLARVKAKLATLDEMYANGEISANTYQIAVDTNTKLLNGEDIIDDVTGQTSNIKDIIADAQKEVDSYYANFGIKANYDGNTASDKDKDKSSSKDKDPEDFDWIETKLNNTSDSLDKVKDKVNDTYSTWENRNKSLQKAIADTQNAINLQAQAEATYLAKANSITLPEYLKSRVRLGDMSIQDNVDENTSKLINEYKEWYDKAKACRDAQDELNASLNELKSTQFFELINSEYDALYTKLDNSLDVLQSKIDKAEMQGLFANESYYTSMIGYTQAKINNLEKERKQLQDVLNSSGVKNDTEAWNEMYQTLMDTDSEIRDLENQIIEFNNNIRDLDWEIFDYLEDSISRIIDETEYLNNLIKESDLFDDKGNFTEYADASIGLYASAYDTQMQQAKDYYEEVQELQTQLLNGAGKDVLERYNEVAEAHRNSVLAAQDEQKAIIELVEKGYQKKIDIMNELIQKTNEAYDSERSLFEYSKSIEEKTKNISSLQKQYNAYKNSDSEEGIAKIQQIKVSLEEAKADLEQTEYEKYIEDSQKMLDELSTEYEEFLNSRLDDEDALLKEIVSGISDKGDKINDTLQTLAKENGTFISDTITSIFDADSPFTSELSGIKANTAGTTNAINALINTVAGIVGTNNKGNAGTNGSNGGNTSNPSKDASKTPSTPSVNNTPSTNNANNVSNNSSKGEYDSIFIHKKYSPQKLNRETSLVDRLKSDNIDASWEARSKYWSKIFGGTYTGSESQNIKFLNWLKANGYKNGVLSASKGLHLFDEEGLGSEIIITKEGALRQFNAGDTVISDEGTKRLWEFAQDPEGYMSKLGLSGLNHPQFVLPTPKTPDMSNLVRRDTSQDVTIKVDGMNVNLPNVTNYKEFRSELIRDNTFTDAIGTYVNNRIMGKNPLEHYKYSYRK